MFYVRLVNNGQDIPLKNANIININSRNNNLATKKWLISYDFD